MSLAVAHGDRVSCVLGNWITPSIWCIIKLLRCRRNARARGGERPTGVTGFSPRCPARGGVPLIMLPHHLSTLFFAATQSPLPHSLNTDTVHTRPLQANIAVVSLRQQHKPEGLCHML